VVHLVAGKSKELAEVDGDPIAWAGMLRCCAALEAFRVRFGAAADPPAVAQFLLLDRLVPRSAAFCLSAALAALEGIDRGDRPSRPHRILGLLAASFQHADPALVGASPDALAARFEERWVDLHQALRASYFRPGRLALELAGDELSRHPQQQQQRAAAR
jgi:uncharacterized alpha-E superfamily protein